MTDEDNPWKCSAKKRENLWIARREPGNHRGSSLVRKCSEGSTHDWLLECIYTWQRFWKLKREIESEIVVTYSRFVRIKRIQATSKYPTGTRSMETTIRCIRASPDTVSLFMGLSELQLLRSRTSFCLFVSWALLYILIHDAPFTISMNIVTHRDKYTHVLVYSVWTKACTRGQCIAQQTRT